MGGSIQQMQEKNAMKKKTLSNSDDTNSQIDSIVPNWKSFPDSRDDLNHLSLIFLFDSFCSKWKPRRFAEHPPNMKTKPQLLITMHKQQNKMMNMRRIYYHNLAIVFLVENKIYNIVINLWRDTNENKIRYITKL